MRANPLDDVLQDVKYAARSLSKTPTFTLVAVLSLALGIGATTTVFSLVDSLLLRPLPVPHPERLVTLEQVSTDGVRQYNLSYDDAERFRELTGNAWSALAATSWADAYDGSGEAAGDWRRAETLRVSLVTGEYFQVLGVRPRAGRALIGQDDSGAASPVAFIADRYWARRFGRSGDAIGRDIQLNGTRFIVVGIAPADFDGDWVGWPTDVWVPSASAAAILPAADGDIRTRLQYKVIARLADGRVGGARAGIGRRGVSGPAAQSAAAVGRHARSPSRARLGRARLLAAARLARAVADHSCGHRRPGAARDRRQRRQPAAGAHGGPRSRAGGPHLARRHPPAAGASADDGEPAAHRRRRRGGPAARRVGHRHPRRPGALGSRRDDCGWRTCARTARRARSSRHLVHRGSRRRRPVCCSDSSRRCVDRRCCCSRSCSGAMSWRRGCRGAPSRARWSSSVRSPPPPSC